MKPPFIVVSLLCLLFVTQPSFGEVIYHNYGHFKLWVDCDERSAIKFEYTIWADTANNKRPSSFYTDPNIPSGCQQTSKGSYNSIQSGWDRGHLVSSNHMDFSSTAIRHAHYITNMLPQRAGMNHGAWLRTEEIAECYREFTDIKVLGGPNWSAGVMNNYFINSHGVRTPQEYWKVLIKQDYYGNVLDAIAWIVPNISAATKGKLNVYLVSIADIEGAQPAKQFQSRTVSAT